MASKPSKAEQRAMAKQESEDQSARVSCAAGAAALGAGLRFLQRPNESIRGRVVVENSRVYLGLERV